ncbi:GAF domain-containing protein [Bermanella marisrubri]|uniref:HD-GYP domain protein n=1 Tax=Bermanella marisrubri TaxID=207949 RepID=Q1N6Q6_9GAMM|nr:HD domain-containing phosphohydrolase [Bermanella marisrubri]EAT13536.1 HD-GYP domain protein [Oceanobacter sp. RED65] [Bermanella marisrubri]QIZ84333.1 GAF domain-containing protein [Bermanella marisrubri]
MDKHNYQTLAHIGRALMSERDTNKLCDLILDEAQKLTQADGGTLYLIDEQPPKHLNFAIVHTETLNIRLQASTGASVFDPLPLYETNGKKNHHHVATHTAHLKTLINIEDAYHCEDFDFSGAKAFDEDNNYRTQSILAVPLLNEMNQLVGVLQLVNARDEDGEIIAFDKDLEPIIAALSSYAATAIENRTISDSQRALLIELAATTNTEEIIERILDESIHLTNAEGGTLYLVSALEDQDSTLRFEIIKNNKLDIYMGGQHGVDIPFPDIPIVSSDGQANQKNVAAYCANSLSIINIEDVYTSEDFDFTGAKTFDEQTGYRTQSVLTFPLLNHRAEVIGVLQLINARDTQSDNVIAFHQRFIPLLRGLALYAAIALNNQILVQDLKDLLDAFVKTIAKAIDAKSPHTSGHCQRVPLLMELIAKAACKDDTVFKDFELSEEEWYELRVSAWMHDCGKLATPDSVLEKSTKLHRMRDGIETIEARFASLKHHSKIQFLEDCLAHPELKQQRTEEFDAYIKLLDDDLEFIKTSNKGGEFMSKESKERIENIAHYQWPDAYGEWHPMLSQDEVYNLCIERGTLSQEERQIINDHMKVTIDMLEGLPFPKQLQRVPEYAGGHHEKMNGSGFPRGLTRQQMSVPARMMAVADVFEALTAKDRPYKDPMKISTSLNILRKMVEDEHIDPDIYQLFVRSRVWEKYAKRILMPEQLDVDDINNYLLSEQELIEINSKLNRHSPEHLLNQQTG